MKTQENPSLRRSKSAHFVLSKNRGLALDLADRETKPERAAPPEDYAPALGSHFLVANEFLRLRPEPQRVSNEELPRENGGCHSTLRSLLR